MTRQIATLSTLIFFTGFAVACGHSSPEHTLRRYIHLLPQEEVDLSFAEISVPKRPYTALPHSSKSPNKNTPDLSGRGHLEKMERETGLEPATLSLGS